MKIHTWKEMPWEQVTHDISRRIITGVNEMVSQVYLKKDALVPEHSHISEQISYIVEGTLKFWVGGEELILRIPIQRPADNRTIADAPDTVRIPLPAVESLSVESRQRRGRRRQDGEQEHEAKQEAGPAPAAGSWFSERPVVDRVGRRFGRSLPRLVRCVRFSHRADCSDASSTPLRAPGWTADTASIGRRRQVELIGFGLAEQNRREPCR